MAELYGFDAAGMKRAVAAIKRIEKQPLETGQRDKFRLEEPQRWFWAVIVCCGPRGCTIDPDFPDNRYWFKRAYVANANEADPDEFNAQVDTSKEKVAVAIEPEYRDGKPNPYYLHRAATHHFEACGTHDVRPGTVVRVFWEYDRSRKAKPRYSLIVADRWATCLKKCEEESSSSSSSKSQSTSTSGGGSSSSSSASKSGSGPEGSGGSQASGSGGCGCPPGTVRTKVLKDITFSGPEGSGGSITVHKTYTEVCAPCDATETTATDSIPCCKCGSCSCSCGSGSKQSSGSGSTPPPSGGSSGGGSTPPGSTSTGGSTSGSSTTPGSSTTTSGGSTPGSSTTTGSSGTGSTGSTGSTGTSTGGSSTTPGSSTNASSSTPKTCWVHWHAFWNCYDRRWDGPFQDDYLCTDGSPHTDWQYTGTIVLGQTTPVTKCEFKTWTNTGRTCSEDADCTPRIETPPALPDVPGPEITSQCSCPGSSSGSGSTGSTGPSGSAGELRAMMLMEAATEAGELPDLPSPDAPEAELRVAYMVDAGKLYEVSWFAGQPGTAVALEEHELAEAEVRGRIITGKGQHFDERMKNAVKAADARPVPEPERETKPTKAKRTPRPVTSPRKVQTRKGCGCRK